MSTMSTRITGYSAPRGQTKGESLSLGALVGALFLFAGMIVTTFDFVHAKEGANFGVDFQTLFRLGSCAAFGLYGCYYLPATKREFFRFPGAWMTLMLAWAVITVPFGAAPLYSMAAVFASACVVLFVPAALSQLGSLNAIKSVLAGLLAFVALNWLLHFTVPSLAKSAFEMPNGEIIYRFGNDSAQLGLQIAWAMGFLLALALTHCFPWAGAIVAGCILLGTLPLTQARTAALATLAVSSVVLWLYSSRRQRLLAISFGFVVVAAACFAVVGGFDLTRDSDSLARSVSRSGQIEELKNFTGRAEIWEYVWGQCFKSPLVGFGFGCSRFALQEDLSYPLSFPADHAHNLYLNVALTMGFPGLAILLAMIGHLAIKNILRPSSIVSIALVVVVVASITESLLFGPMPRSHMFLWSVALFWQQMGMEDQQVYSVSNGGVR